MRVNRRSHNSAQRRVWLFNPAPSLRLFRKGARQRVQGGMERSLCEGAEQADRSVPLVAPASRAFITASTDTVGVTVYLRYASESCASAVPPSLAGSAANSVLVGWASRGSVPSLAEPCRLACSTASSRGRTRLFWVLMVAAERGCRLQRTGQPA